MSFSSETKKELCAIATTQRGCCRHAQEYGALLFGDEPIGVREDFFHHNATLSHTLQRGNMADSCCMCAFLRGVFLSCGYVSDPRGQRHLEFAVGSKKLAKSLRDYIAEEIRLEDENFPLQLKMFNRNGSWMLYCKDGEQIGEFLAQIGAQNAYLKMIGAFIEKDVRNRVNRQTNFDMANIGRQSAACVRQCTASARLRENGLWETLPPALREAARLREDNPGATLGELAALSRDNVSRSGMNHRLERLCTLAARTEAP
jgi:DNA-binding protein WhiA